MKKSGRALYLFMLLAALFGVSCSGGGGGGVFFIPTGSATLTWSAVTTYEDGSSLTPAGYIIRYGTSPGRYTHAINVSHKTATTYTVSGLPLGSTYYFVVTAYDASGIQSAYSNRMSKKL